MLLPHPLYRCHVTVPAIVMFPLRPCLTWFAPQAWHVKLVRRVVDQATAKAAVREPVGTTPWLGEQPAKHQAAAAAAQVEHHGVGCGSLSAGRLG
jgi:hypothetical protein